MLYSKGKTILTSNQCNHMEFNSREREVLASALKLKLKQTIALEKKVIAELGDSSQAAKSMLLERSNIEALHHKLEGQSKLLD